MEEYADQLTLLFIQTLCFAQHKESVCLPPAIIPTPLSLPNPGRCTSTPMKMGMAKMTSGSSVIKRTIRYFLRAPPAPQWSVAAAPQCCGSVALQQGFEMRTTSIKRTSKSIRTSTILTSLCAIAWEVGWVKPSPLRSRCFKTWMAAPGSRWPMINLGQSARPWWCEPLVTTNCSWWGKTHLMARLCDTFFQYFDRLS